MPQISRFYGIVITMYYDEQHGRPHFHARYAARAAVLAIDTGEVLAGSLPSRALRLVRDWAELHRI